MHKGYIVGKINAAWHLAMSTLWREFSKDEQSTGWPETLEPRQLAALQYPYTIDEPEKKRFFELRAGAILTACKSGELPHTLTTVKVIPKPPKSPPQNHFAPYEWLARDGLITGLKTKSNKQPYDVTTYVVTAPAFAAWLAAQRETPSKYIAVWFDTVEVNIKPEAAPVPTAIPATVTTQTTKRRDLLVPLVEAAQKACDSAGDAAAVFTKLKTWAKENKPRAPLVGVTEDGRIQWRDSNDTPKELDKKALAKRLQRQKEQTATTPPGKQLRRLN
jgi:hypothetical protein